MIHSLPDEILESIFEFGIENPEEIISYSQVCKQFNEILVENLRMWEFVKLSNLSKLRIGFRWSQLISNPIYQVLDTGKGFINRLKGGYSDPNGKSLLSEIRENLNTREYLKWMKYYKMDKTVKKILKFREIFYKIIGNWPLIALSILTLICMDVMLVFGLMSQVEEDDRTLSGGMWWLPYSFLPFYVIFYFGIILFSLCGMAIFLHYWRKFMINKSISEKYDRHFGYVFDSIVLHFTISLGFGVYYGLVFGVSSVFLNWAGQELSPFHSTINSIIYGTVLFILMGILVRAGSKPRPRFENLFNAGLPVLFFLFTGSIYYLLPLSIYFTVKSLMMSRIEIFGLDGFLHWLPIGASITSVMLCLKTYSYFSMIPLTMVLVLSTLERCRNSLKN